MTIILFDFYLNILIKIAILVFWCIWCIGFFAKVKAEKERMRSENKK